MTISRISELWLSCCPWLRSYTSGLSVNGTQYCDGQQPQFTQCVFMTQVAPPVVPKLVGFTVEDHDNLDAVLSVGDQYHLTFDVPTDQHLCEPTCSGGPDYVGGHPLPFPHHISNCGDLDLVGNQKPQSMYRNVN